MYRSSSSVLYRDGRRSSSSHRYHDDDDDDYVRRPPTPGRYDDDDDDDYVRRPPTPGRYHDDDDVRRPSKSDYHDDDEVAEDVVYLLCQADGGETEVSELFRSLPSHHRQNFKKLSRFTRFLKRHDDVFAVVEDRHESVVRPWTTLDICKGYTTNEGCRDRRCGGLHICKYFLISEQCRFPDSKCRYGHTLKTNHNEALIRQHKLSSLPLPYLRKVFNLSRSNLKNTAPQPCKFYNVGAGCNRGDKCNHLHVCRHYLAGSCKFADSCKRSHRIKEGQNINILRRNGIDTRQTERDLLTMLREMSEDVDDVRLSPSRHARGSPSPARLGSARPFRSTPELFSPKNRQLQPMRTLSVASAVDDDETEICMFYLRGKCGFGKSCRMHHKEDPYQWQYHDDDIDEWVDMSDSSQTEIDYCKVESDECYVALTVNSKDGRPTNTVGKIIFGNNNAMTLNIPKANKTLKARRLSTASSVQKPDTFAYVTEWVWYWMDEHNKWKKYGDENDKHFKSNVDVEDVENAYLSSGTSLFHFDTTEGHKYDLDFSKMVQRNVMTKVERKVRRRPELIDWNERAKEMSHAAAKNSGKASATNHQTAPKKPRKSANGAGDATTGASSAETKAMSLMSSYIPSHWDIYGAGDGSSVQLVKLDRAGSTAQEFQTIETKFKASMPSSRITSIKRIQSMEVYDAYYRKKSWTQKNRKKEPKVLSLFHGTKKGNIQAICEQGFDCRISGLRTGTRYGKGTYFGVEANVAAHYADSRCMLMCNVLVGDPCQGLSHYVRPPPKDPSKPNENFYDSCVDNTSIPRMYIIFKSDQVYPEYIIDYD